MLDGAGQDVVLYDISRLISRRNAASATGIDRVDIEFALHLNSRSERTIYVAQAGGQLHDLPDRLATKLLQELDSRWNGSAKTARDFSRELRDAGVLSAPALQKPKPSSKSTFHFLKFLKEEDYNFLINKDQKGRLEFFQRTSLLKYTPSWLHWIRLVETPLKRVLSHVPGVLKPFTHFEAPSRPKIVATPRAPLAARLKARILETPGATTFYLNFSHHGLLSRNVFRELRNQHRCRFVFYVHDLIPIDYPEYCRPGTKDDHIERMKNVLDYGDAIICNSEYTKERLASFAATVDRTAAPMAVANIGFREPAPRARASTIDDQKPYFVIVGTIEGRKNHVSLLNLWRSLAMTGGDIPSLYIIGRRGWCNQSALDILDHCDAVGASIVELNEASDETMFKLVRGARALLFPSFVEGWGMPLVEAMALRVPVVCSDIPVFHEASQGLAHFVDPLDVKRWREVVLELSKTESELRDSLSRKLEAFSPPRWEDAFHVLDDQLKIAALPLSPPLAAQRAGADHVSPRRALKPVPASFFTEEQSVVREAEPLVTSPPPGPAPDRPRSRPSDNSANRR